MAFKLWRGHSGPCPLPTQGESLGAIAIGELHQEFNCYCGRVWQIEEFCPYCNGPKIAHNRHHARPYWVVVEDEVWVSRLALLYGTLGILSMIGLVIYWPF